jgi:hypothetical protein
VFKWSCLVAAAIFSGVLLWMINDLRVQVRKSVDTVNRDLPQILEKTRDSTETMATLSQDIKQLRELVVGDASAREGKIIAYETDVLRLIENSNGKIGVKKALGTGLADPVPAQEWVMRERKAALWDLARSRSKADLLNRIGRSAVLNRVWYIVTGDKKVMPLVDWVKANHPDSLEQK